MSDTPISSELKKALETDQKVDPLTAEERVEFIKDELDQTQFDALQLLNRDPSYHYRFGRQTEMAMARNKFRGYEVVDRNTDAVRSILSDSTPMKKGADIDSAITAGDMILLRIPRHKFEENMRRREERVNRVTRSVAASAKRAINSAAGANVAFEEHKENRAMRGMSQRAYDKFEQEERQEQREKARQDARNR